MSEGFSKPQANRIAWSASPLSNHTDTLAGKLERHNSTATKIYAPSEIRRCETAELTRRRLKQLDRISIRIVQLDLLPAWTYLHFVAKP